MNKRNYDAAQCTIFNQLTGEDRSFYDEECTVSLVTTRDELKKRARMLNLSHNKLKSSRRKQIKRELTNAKT